MQATPGQQALDARTTRILNHEGDWGNSPDINWASGQVAALKNERAQRNRGAYTFGSQYADPNLLAALGTQEEAQAAQDEQLGRERAIAGAIDSASANALASGGLTAQRYGSVMGNAAQLAGNYNDAYTRLQSQPGFWSQALLGGLGAVGSVAGAASKPWMFSDARLKTNIKYPTGDWFATWDWNGKANELGLYGTASGVIAQDIETKFQNLVRTHPSGYKQVDYASLSTLLPQELKSLRGIN